MSGSRNNSLLECNDRDEIFIVLISWRDLRNLHMYAAHVPLELLKM